MTDDHLPVPGQSSGADARTPGADAGGPGPVGLPDPDAEAEWSRAVKILDEATEICLACHIRPDGDALGSMLAVAHALRARHAAGSDGAARRDGTAPQDGAAGQAPRAVRVVASFGDLPFEIPRILRFLPGADLLSPPDTFPERPQVMVTFDAASADRLGILEARARRADELIVLDHHASNTRFGTVNLVDPAAAATAVLAFDLIRRMGVEISRDIALGLYAGLRSHNSCATTPGSMPVCSSRAANWCTRGDVVEYLNEPVSVTSPAYRPSAMSREMSTPILRIRSNASTAVAAAAGSIRFTVPNLVLDAW